MSRERQSRVGEPRLLTKDDLARLDARPTTPVHVITRLRNSHHNIARLSAIGLKNKDIAERTGYTRERISVLLQAPAMIDLVARLRNQIDEAFFAQVDSYYELATNNMVAAERHISDRIADLDEAGELLPLREAMLVSRDSADRFGYGKKQTNVNVNVDFAAQLEKAIRRSGKVIEGSDHTSVSPTPRPLNGPVSHLDSVVPLHPPATHAPSSLPNSALVEAPQPSFRRRA